MIMKKIVLGKNTFSKLAALCAVGVVALMFAGGCPGSKEDPDNEPQNPTVAMAYSVGGKIKLKGADGKEVEKELTQDIYDVFFGKKKVEGGAIKLQKDAEYEIEGVNGLTKIKLDDATALLVQGKLKLKIHDPKSGLPSADVEMDKAAIEAASLNLFTTLHSLAYKASILHNKVWLYLFKPTDISKIGGSVKGYFAGGVNASADITLGLLKIGIKSGNPVDDATNTIPKVTLNTADQGASGLKTIFDAAMALEPEVLKSDVAIVAIP